MSHPCSADGGSFTAFVAVLSVALLSLIGLVVDGGRAVTATDVARAQAQQAARAGAAQLSVDALRRGIFEIDPARARQAAEHLLVSMGAHGAVTVSGNSVQVRVTATQRTVLLGIIGIDRLALSVSARASDVHGVSRSDP